MNAGERVQSGGGSARPNSCRTFLRVGEQTTQGWPAEWRAPGTPPAVRALRSSLLLGPRVSSYGPHTRAFVIRRETRVESPQVGCNTYS